MKKSSLLILFLVTSLAGFCDTFEVTVDGIQYTCDTETHEATAIGLSNKSIVLLEFPATITVDEVVYNVTCVSRMAYLADLEEVRFPEGLKYIGEKNWGGTFNGCSKLKKINFPSTMIALTSMSFNDCPLTETDLTIPIGFTNANRTETKYRNRLSESFRGTQLRSVAVADGHPFLTYNNGVIIDDYTDPYANPYGDSSGKYLVLASASATEIPEGVEYVGEAFRNHKDITTISFPSTYRGSMKFSNGIERYNPIIGCSGLTTITVSASNPDFESRGMALIYKPLLELTGGCDATIIPNDVEIIGDNAFSQCTFSIIDIPQSVTEIKGWAFHDCRNLESITIPENVTAIGRNAFGNCPALTSMKFKSKKPISLPTGNVNGKEACVLFSGSWTNLTAYPTLYVPVGTKNAYKYAKWYDVFRNIVEDETLGSVETKEAVVDGLKYSYVTEFGTAKVIRKDWSFNYSQLTAVVIPATVEIDGTNYNVTAIGQGCFGSSPELSSVTLPEGLITIEAGAFSVCPKLQSIDFPSTLEVIGHQGFSQCDIRSVTIPASVRDLNVFTFFNNPNLQTIVVEAGNTVYDSRDNCNAIIRTANNQLIQGSLSTVIPNTVTSMWSGFSHLNIESINIPASLVDFPTVGQFSECEKLTTITVDAGNPVFESRENCIIEKATKTLYYGCKNSTIPDDIKIIRAQAFAGHPLTSITIPSSVTCIETCAFTGCQLETITLPENLTEIGKQAFEMNLNLTTIKSKIKNPFALSGDITSFKYYDNFRVDAEGNVTSDEHPIDVTLYVPVGTKLAYETTDGWKDFPIIVEDETLGGVEIPSSASIKVAKGMTTYTSEYNLDFSGFGDDVKAYVATGYDYDKNTIWLTRVKDVPAGTPILVQAPASETPYDVPVKASSGCYFKNMLVGNLSGGEITLSATTGDMTNYYLSNGKFLTATGSNTIGNGKAYLQIPTTPPAANVGSSQSVKLNDYGFASFCGSQDLDFTDVEGLKAFAVTGYDDANGTIWLTRVKRVSAQTPLLLKGDSKESYTVPSVAVGSYYANMMKGNLSGSTITIYTTDGDMTNYYLKGNQLLKATDGGNTIGNGKAYMQIPTKHVTRSMEDIVNNLIYGISGDEPEVISIPVVNARGINGDGTTNIREKLTPEQTNDVYYNLQGQRVEHPTKGLYIKNGKKIVVQ